MKAVKRPKILGACTETLAANVDWFFFHSSPWSIPEISLSEVVYGSCTLKCGVEWHVAAVSHCDLSVVFASETQSPSKLETATRPTIHLPTT